MASTIKTKLPRSGRLRARGKALPKRLGKTAKRPTTRLRRPTAKRPTTRLRRPTKRTRARSMAGRGLAVVAAVAGGAVLKHFLDPERGAARRSRTADQAAATVRGTAEEAADSASKATRQAKDKARGKAAQVVTPADEQVPETDRALADKVRSEVLGRQPWDRHTINIDAVDGKVTLRGELDHPDDIRSLQAAVAKVPGVREVEHHLHLPNTPPDNTQAAREASARGGGRSFG